MLLHHRTGEKRCVGYHPADFSSVESQTPQCKILHRWRRASDEGAVSRISAKNRYGVRIWIDVACDIGKNWPVAAVSGQKN